MAGDRGPLVAKIIAMVGMILFLIPAAVIAGVALAEAVMGGGLRASIVAGVAGFAWIAGVLVFRRLLIGPKKTRMGGEDR